MEIFLLIVILLFLISKLHSMSSKIDVMNNNISYLHELIANLKVNASEKTIEPKAVVEAENQTVPIVVKEPEKVILEDKTPKVEAIRVETVAQTGESWLVEEPAQSIVEEERQLSWFERFREQNPDLEKFVGENLISKIGVLILVLGISYFVKFAIDNDWINEPARVGIGILCGGIVLGFAHRLRANYTAFSSVLVAGAIAIFYFTIGIAFHQYQLFSQTVAFVLMVIITAFSVFISVSYNRMELAILSLIGGFAVPFMVSTGSGNYQVLFTYISILDIGILVIAYQKKWRWVNILAFVFTVVLYLGWFSRDVVNQPNAPYWGAFIFATIFFLIFTLVNIINNVRSRGTFTPVELGIMLSNTFLYFSAGIIILGHFHPEFKGLFTIALALFNLGGAWVLYKKIGLDKNAIYLLIGLTLTFATLAIPIQFSGNQITLFWAAEAVLLLWLSQRSRIAQFRFASVVVHFLMFDSLLMDWVNVYGANSEGPKLLLNAGFIAGIFATLSLAVSSILIKNEREEIRWGTFLINPIFYKKIAEILAIILLYFTGLLEVIAQSNFYFSSKNSAISLPVTYHLLFSTVLCFFLVKSTHLLRQKTVVIIALSNVFLYIVLFSIIPFQELQENLSLNNSSRMAFALHYANVLCVIYVGWLVFQNCKTTDSLSLGSQQWFVWVAIFAIVFVASHEILLHGLQFLTQPVVVKNDSTALIAPEMYQKSKTQIVKVAFPILWGFLAFVFLTIGIKNQSRTLRIIALVLLGITIAKLFFYDISNSSETGKIIAFILLGVVILVMSFAYQKIKTIVMNKDDENEESK